MLFNLNQTPQQKEETQYALLHSGALHKLTGNQCENIACPFLKKDLKSGNFYCRLIANYFRNLGHINEVAELDPTPIICMLGIKK